jgi:hypothetical protein
MWAVGDREDAIARHGHAAVDAAGCIADQSFGPWLPIPPDFASVAGIERVAPLALVIHDAVDHERRHLERPPYVKTHFGASLLTLVLSICVSVV